MAAKIFKQICQMTTAFGRRRPPPNLGALAIPTELILTIAEYLPKTAVISLALTCRTLYSYRFPAGSVLNKKEREGILLMLERDVPSVYFCHYCVKLHSWRPASRLYLEKGSHRSNSILTTCPQIFSKVFDAFKDGTIPYFLTRIIMNRHFYRPGHGPPLYTLDSHTHPDKRNGIVTSEYQRARIVDDKLLLFSHILISHPGGGIGAFRDFIASPGCKRICWHHPINRVLHVPQHGQEMWLLSPFSHCDRRISRSCPFCMTDCCIETTWGGPNGGYIINAYIYRQIGDYRSPLDPRWTSFAGYAHVGRTQTTDPQEYRAGNIRDLWNSVDGTRDGSQSKWIEGQWSLCVDWRRKMAESR